MKICKITVKNLLYVIKRIIVTMTTQITALLRDKVVTASDGAVTVDNIKAWKNVKKTFRLCDNPPINIMINGSPIFNNFPINILIDEFKKCVKSDNIEDITQEFLEYIGKPVPKNDAENYIKGHISRFKLIYGPVDEKNYENFLDIKEIFNIEIPEFLNTKYDLKFEEMIEINLPISKKNEMIIILKKIFCHYLMLISTGVVISGISSNDYFPSSISFNMILNDNGKIEIINKKTNINCNKTKLDVYGQTEVIDSYFTGIDEKFEITLFKTIKKIFNPSDKELEILKKDIEKIKIKNKNNMLSRVDSLPDNDLYEMLETLIKSTELKQKLLSNIDSVSGNVHIEKITKNNEIETNEKTYKLITTIKNRGEEMFLIPFVNNHKSYCFEPKQDTSTADAELKRWIDDFNAQQKMVDQIHEETMQEMGKRSK